MHASHSNLASSFVVPQISVSILLQKDKRSRLQPHRDVGLDLGDKKLHSRSALSRFLVRVRAVLVYIELGVQPKRHLASVPMRPEEDFEIAYGIT